MKLFNLDSPLMQGLTKVADLLWLNILTIICSVPIVTIGASLTAMNYMALKMSVEFEEGQEPKTVMAQVLKNCKEVEDDCEMFF